LTIGIRFANRHAYWISEGLLFCKVVVIYSNAFEENNNYEVPSLYWLIFRGTYLDRLEYITYSTILPPSLGIDFKFCNIVSFKVE